MRIVLDLKADLSVLARLFEHPVYHPITREDTPYALAFRFSHAPLKLRAKRLRVV